MTDTATEERDPPILCERCGDEIDPDDCTYTVLVNRRSVLGPPYRLDITEEWCENCYSADAVCAEDVSPRTDGMVSVGYAENNLYWHECDSIWRDYPEEEPEDECDDDCLMSYGTDVIDVLGWPSMSQTKGERLLFGVELEMEGKRSHSANDIVAILGGARGTRRDCAILKSDGSLADGRGVELVTLPYPLAYHQSAGFWQDLLDSRLQAAAMSGAGTTNCGIHVHISRAALSPLTIGKMVVFLNNPDNSAFVTTIAQRRSGGYCQRDEKKKVTSAMPGREAYNSRYDIINVTGGATVEIRMFRGNLRPERVLKNVEFCHALVRWCESSGITESQRWGAFCHWVGKQRKTYPNLVAFLTEQTYLPPARVAAPVLADL